MKSLIYRIEICAAATALMAGCAASQKATNVISVSPSPYTVTADEQNEVHLDMMFHVPAKYVSTRCRLVMTPYLKAGDSLTGCFTPTILDAPVYIEKLRRREKLEGYVDPHADRAIHMDKTSRAYDLAYRESLRLPEGINEGHMVAVVEANGCGRCRTVDTIDMATVSNPVALMPAPEEVMKLDWIEPRFVIRPKIAEGRGVAHLQFAINRYDINLETGDNRRELEEMTATLAPILEDSLATLTSLQIVGMASADGLLAYNTTLAKNRALAASQWLVRRLDLSPEVRRNISVGSRPEGWQPVLDAMIRANDKDSTSVQHILTRYAHSNDDVQEYHIRRLPCWQKIREHYLQKDRKVEYTYTYRIKSFSTDAEMIEMYAKRPDAFNEEELLRVAALAPTHEQKKEVYRTLIHYFPQSKVAANNLAVLYLREGDTAKARMIIDSQEEYSDEMLNTLAVSYVYAHDYEKAIELLQEIDSPQARYNLGIIRAKQRRLTSAYELLLPFADLNTAICALSVNDTDRAAAILSTLNEHSPLAEYLRALVAARREDSANLFRHLPEACREERLKLRAREEGDFAKYRHMEEFRHTVGPEKTEF